MTGAAEQAETAAVYRRLLGYSFQHWPMFLAAIVGMVLYAAIQTSFAAMIKPLLDQGFVNRDPDFIRILPALIFAIFVVRGAASFMESYCMEWVGRRVVKTMRGELFAKFLELPTRFYDETSSGVLLSKLTYNTEQVAQAATRVVTTLVRDTLTIAGLLGWMLWINTRLTLFILVVGPLMAILIRTVSRYFRRYSARIQNSMGDVTQVAEEVLEAHRVVKVFNGEQYELGEFEAVNEKNRYLHMKLAATKGGSTPIIQLLAAAGLASVIYVATLDSGENGISVGDFSSFLSAMLLLMDPLKRLTNINAPLQQGIAAGKSIFDLLDQPSEEDHGGSPIDRARGGVEYRGVSFAYQADKGHALADIDLRVEPGERVAFVGRSGSGKTTLVSLLPRFYDPTEGVVMVDGRDVREYPLDGLRRQISMVGQDVKLFNDTIFNNIAYGGMRGASDDAVHAAAEAAHVLEFCERLPDGLQTWIGDRGVMLSGGQRQRVAIARALLKNAPILILDEATSALDTESERSIQSALEHLMQGRTTLVIAHRLSTIEGADRIVVMDRGRIIEQGSHAELQQRDGPYAALHRLQFEGS